MAMTCFASSVIVVSERLGVAEISATLGAATCAFEKGSPILANDPRSRRRTAATWHYESALGAGLAFEEHLAEIVRYVETHRDALNRLSASCQLILSFGMSSDNGQGGFGFTHEQLTRLAALPVACDFDCYLTEDDSVSNMVGN